MAGEILRCPVCGETMFKKNGYWKCPRCGGEWWPDEYGQAAMAEAARDTAAAKEQRRQMLWSLSKTHTVVLPLLGGIVHKGSSKSGRKRKKPPKKELPGFET